MRENVCSRRCIYGKKLKRRIYMADIELYEELQEWYPGISAPDAVSNALSVRKMGNELWQIYPSADHRLRIQTKTHVAGRISLTSNPSANWHVELTPIVMCQSPFNSDSTAADLAEGAEKFRREVSHVHIYPRVRVHMQHVRVHVRPCNVWGKGEKGGEGFLLTSSANLRRNYSTRLFPPSAVS